MNNSIRLLVVLAIVFVGCADKKSNDPKHDSAENHSNMDGFHVHEDGSVHPNHTNTEHTQEEFKISDDTSYVKSDSLANKTGKQR